MTAFIARQRHARGAHRSLACAARCAERGGRGPIHPGARLCVPPSGEHTFPPRLSRARETPLSFVVLSGFLIFRGQGRPVELFLFIVLCRVAFPPPRRCLWGLAVGLAGTSAFHGGSHAQVMGGSHGRALAALPSALGAWLCLGRDHYSRTFCPARSRLGAS